MSQSKDAEGNVGEEVKGGTEAGNDGREGTVTTVGRGRERMKG